MNNQDIGTKRVYGNISKNNALNNTSMMNNYSSLNIDRSFSVASYQNNGNISFMNN